MLASVIVFGVYWKTRVGNDKNVLGELVESDAKWEWG